MAGVATFHAHVRELFGGVDRKFRLVFLIASRANDPAVLPLQETETAEQATACAITLLPEDPESGFAAAERAQRMGVAVELQRSVGASGFCVRLQKSESKKLFRTGGRVIGCGPAVVEEVGPGSRGRVTEPASDLSEATRGFFFNQFKKSGEAAEEFRKLCPVRQREYRLVDRDGFYPQVKPLLEAGHVQVEAEDFRRKGMLACQLFGAPDALLPGILGHRAIMGLGLSTRNWWGVWAEDARLTANELRDYSFVKIGSNAAPLRSLKGVARPCVYQRS